MIAQDSDNSSNNGKLSDFSIDHILNRAGSSSNNSANNVEQFEWLQCSRYCPPRVPRVNKRDVHKRQLGRHPRIPFTSYQLSVLEQKFKETPYLSSEEVIVLSRKLQLADIRVKIWFQNRRARERREKTSDKVQRDKNSHVSVEHDSRLMGPVENVEFPIHNPPVLAFNSNVGEILSNNVSSTYLLNGLPVFLPLNVTNKDVGS